jgi:uncharacterized protein YtpQ (UPF0354 family)
VLARTVLFACALLVLLAAGCSGDGGSGADDATLPDSAFKETVVGEIKRAGLEAEPGFDLNVTAFDGPNRVELALDDALAEYEADPDRRDEIVADLVDEAERRLDAGIGEVSIEEARPDLMPLLQGVFDVRQLDFEPAKTSIPGNLDVLYVVDADDAYTVVRPEDVERWGTTVKELHDVATDNLLRQTNAEEELLCEPSGAGQDLCGWASSDGYDATRMIVPGLRRQIVREYGGPAVYAVPMDNVFVALPLEVLDSDVNEKRLRARVEHDFQTSETPVSPELFVERDGELAVLK